MVQKTGYRPGTPSWVDIGTTDLDAAKDFYCSLFGWEAEDQIEDGTRVYTMFSLRGQSVAGGAELPEEVRAMGVPPHWTTYVSVEDADATVAAVKLAGGQALMDPMTIFEAGRMSTLMDPVGATFAVWQPMDHFGAEVVNEPGALCWNELNTRDVERAIEFYSAVFGWKVEAQEMPGGIVYREIKLNGDSVGGIMEMGPQFPPDVPSHWMTYFAVDDCDASATKAGDLGGQVIVPGMDIEPGRFSVLQDPQGAPFAIIQLKEIPT